MNNLLSKKSGLTTLLLLGSFVFVAVPLRASVIEVGEDIQFTPLHRIDDDVYAISSGSNISMDGYIDGDFSAFAYSLAINGEITGTANLFAYSFNHNGKIEGSIRAFVQSININGIVERSVLVSSNTFILGSRGLVKRDVHAFCGQADIGGTVKGDVHIRAGEVRITGVIEGNVDIKAERIIISSPAVIKGNLTYESDEPARIDTSRVVIEGTTEWVKPAEAEAKGSETLSKTVVIVSELLAAFLFGLLMLVPFRRYAKESLAQLSKRFVVSLAVGFITVFLFLTAIALAVLSGISFLIGYGLISSEVPAAGAIVLVVSTIVLPISAFGAVFGGILIYLGKIVLAFLIGYLVVQLVKKDSTQLNKTQLLIGLIVLSIIFAIPYLGVVLSVLGSVTGAGAIILAIRRINFEISRTESEKHS